MSDESIPLTVLADCLDLHVHAVRTVQGLSCLLFRPAFRWSHIHVILFCNLIGGARFQSLEVRSLNPPMLPSSLFSFLFENESLGRRLISASVYVHRNLGICVNSRFCCAFLEPRNCVLISRLHKCNLANVYVTD